MMKGTLLKNLSWEYLYGDDGVPTGRNPWELAAYKGDPVIIKEQISDIEFEVEYPGRDMRSTVLIEDVEVDFENSGACKCDACGALFDVQEDFKGDMAIAPTDQKLHYLCAKCQKKFGVWMCGYGHWARIVDTDQSSMTCPMCKAGIPGV